MTEGLRDAMVAIALAPPQHRNGARKAYVPWEYIEKLRDELVEGGYVTDNFKAWLGEGKRRQALGLRPQR